MPENLLEKTRNTPIDQWTMINVAAMLSEIYTNMKNMKKEAESQKESMLLHNEKHEGHMADILREIKDIPRPPYTKDELNKKFDSKASIEVKQDFDKVKSYMIIGFISILAFLIASGPIASKFAK